MAHRVLYRPLDSNCRHASVNRTELGDRTGRSGGTIRGGIAFEWLYYKAKALLQTQRFRSIGRGERNSDNGGWAGWGGLVEGRLGTEA